MVEIKLKLNVLSSQGWSEDEQRDMNLSPSEGKVYLTELEFLTLVINIDFSGLHASIYMTYDLSSLSHQGGVDF